MHKPPPTKLARLSSYLKLMKDMAKQGHASVPRQAFEMALLFVYRGLGPGYYLFGRFWRREIPLHSKLRHLNEKAYAKKISEVNHPDYQKMTQNKLTEKALFNLYSIPTPRFFGHLHPTEGLACDNTPLRDGHDLERLLEKTRPHAICVKLVEGWGGEGFQAAHVRYNDTAPKLVSMVNGATFSTIEFVNNTLTLSPEYQGYIVEEFCQQHTWYSAINPTSVNTLRIYAMCPPGRPTNILGGYLRVGRHNSITDNASTGGLFFVLNPRSGILGPGVFNEIGSAEYSKHPDSGVQLEGCKVPHWDKVCEIIPKALGVFPNTQYAGLDIAVTQEGPVLIEINCQPDRGAACDIDIPTIDMLTP